MKLNGECNMELIEIKCRNCHKGIYIENDHVREKMFCTLGCMNIFEIHPKKMDVN